MCCSVLQCVAVCCSETLYLCLLHMRVTSESAGGCVGERASPAWASVLLLQMGLLRTLQGVDVDRGETALHVHSQKSALHSFCMVNVSGKRTFEKFLGRDSECKLNVSANWGISVHIYLSVYLDISVQVYIRVWQCTVSVQSNSLQSEYSKSPLYTQCI